MARLKPLAVGKQKLNTHLPAKHNLYIVLCNTQDEEPVMFSNEEIKGFFFGWE